MPSQPLYPAVGSLTHKECANQARDIVEAFLKASMVPDPDAAATYVAETVDIHFTGATAMSHPREMTAYNASRYRWVKKQLGQLDVVAYEGYTVVYSIGTLYGEWPDGEPFSGNRYIDRFEVRDGLIVKIDVWNDSAERILKRESPEV